ncbi:receptor-type tyrosine- phosphatase C isoform X1 [Pelobates cultripes]|uniref:Receptor-type tyrosine-protein phosphatase C n=1 Tax=Pelobates cultripes TaxID=61616 RepID=A0AAD1SZC1_PELCU|nr:receptor-type tyrosine- phosphatase C isoform X1 [Pelobates cultripes]CAH2311690.1 receptor-type tyrosine- phosphatase C isoform X1 [Pelobates cultripes]
MIPYLHLLVIGALLWNQNSIVAEDSSPPTTTTKKSGPDTTKPTTIVATTQDQQALECAKFKLQKKRYNNPELHLKLVDEKKIESNRSLKCNKNESSPFVFQVLPCENPDIICYLINCTNPLTYNEIQKPAEKDFDLIVTVGNTSVTFTWNTTLKHCEVRGEYTCSSDNVNETQKNGKQSGLNGNVSGLVPYTDYNCTAILFYGNHSIKEETKQIKTRIGTPGKVRNLDCKETNTTISIIWDDPDTFNGPQPLYNIEVNEKYSSREGHAASFQNIINRMYNVSGLKPYTDYIIKVVAVQKDEINNSLHAPEETRECKTAPGIPGKVKSIDTKFKSNNFIHIHCKAPEKINGPVQNFILYINEIPTFNKSDCVFDVKDLHYLTTYNFKIVFHNGVYLGDSEPFQRHTRYNVNALIGFLAFLIVITSLALLLVLYKIYNLQKKSSRQYDDNIPLAQNEEDRLLNIEPILVENLLDTYKRKNADEGRLFLDEFQSIPRVFSKFSIKEARKSCNQAKNRYIDILPYDDNRVVLSEISGEPGSDYINASYINGFKEPRKYIAAQGPKEETMNDFWRMIWEQKSTIIVMVTRCEEGNRNKCAQYWPILECERATFGDVEVTMNEEKIFPDYITRKLHITNKREKSKRSITHIQFTVWPDHGVPDDPNLLLKLRRRVNALSNFFSGPIVVHCSAGVGRTGTYISIDAMLEGVEAEGRVDVYGYVVQLRRQRCLMVQVESQYIFIHKALVEYNQFGETEVNMLELPLTLNNLKKKDSSSEPSQLECEFQRIPSYRNWRPQSTGNHTDNKDKNCDPNVIPYEYNRVLIKPDDGQTEERHAESDVSSDEDSDDDESIYINASFITGYWGTRAIIAAQGPLKNTVSEFWKMVYQKKVKTIVMLSGPSEKDKEGTCFPYWLVKKQSYDDLEVEVTDEKVYSSYTQRSFEIRHTKRKDVKIISQYHYDQWEDTLPTETKDLLEMIEIIHEMPLSKTEEEENKCGKPPTILVHCRNGAQLTGTFCGLWNILESANAEGVIDVFQTVKNLRKQRPGMVYSFEHYQFLYDTLASTVPAQNGQVKTHTKQEDKLEFQNELETKHPEIIELLPRASSQEFESGPKPAEDESAPNGPSAAPFTEVTLRIDE